MNPGAVGQAIGLFAVTNIDDVLVLALFFARGAGDRRAVPRIVAGQYVGFVGIVAVAVAAASGAALLPESAIAYLGLLPLALGLRAARRSLAERGDRAAATTGDPAGPGPDPDDEAGSEEQDRDASRRGPAALEVAAVTFANGGDNLGVYVPVFTAVGAGGTAVHAVVFLVLVAVWCAAGWFLATRPPVARALSRWGHVLLPLALVAIGLTILVEGGAFGL
ncbi:MULTISPECIES: cadmium resistance transporter [unclassified Parafrankia]|uniref:cadmium resistance transporter n=1 Tax=unclassified Parafrankia TaxID=2994368 RepID=UPI000DA56494|nr:MULTISPECIES: cadmium resistance transporter [unclassified Parafrankia]TCJ36128.1 cadmium transporter [Parafrankia sp. BMG5.11]SQD96351.1 Cadmium resistance transporter [Parafrankia sp. Ea1.12]